LALNKVIIDYGHIL